MKLSNRFAAVLVLTFGFGMCAGVPATATPVYQGEAYPAPYTDLRGLIDRTQTDLRAAGDLEHGNDKQRGRYRNAQERLSNFDRHLVKGRFEKGELNHAIDDIKDILEHNTLQASSRDALMHDVEDLRVARDRAW